MAWRAALSALSVLALVLGGPASSQQVPLERGSVISPILTIDGERVFIESAFGKRVTDQAAAQEAALEAENERIAAELEAEERELTERRPSLSPEEFRVLADAFDAKVQRTRSAQAAKIREINEQIERERDVFLRAAAPVLEQLMRESGAAVILERRFVFVSVSAVEITDEAIARIDENLGSGDAEQ